MKSGYILDAWVEKIQIRNKRNEQKKKAVHNSNEPEHELGGAYRSDAYFMKSPRLDASTRQKAEDWFSPPRVVSPKRVSPRDVEPRIFSPQSDIDVYLK